jgi:hypothetical protein
MTLEHFFVGIDFTGYCNPQQVNWRRLRRFNAVPFKKGSNLAASRYLMEKLPMKLFLSPCDVGVLLHLTSEAGRQQLGPYAPTPAFR